MKKILLIQHCQSLHHVEDLTGGWTDCSLSEHGVSQAKMTGSYIKGMNLEHPKIYSSDLKRAKETADQIANTLTLPVETESGLREINNGIAANKTKEWAHKNRIQPMPKGIIWTIGNFKVRKHGANSIPAFQLQ
ncbi:histidine phosphatase family protein [Desulfogranum japonicum]|uniref:histidine phosphatase family protein n=1 Tax=Desulfogranum japonicum TaxID=231447 RepID=UPI0006881FDA|nr:histidine phosphatase family protein [Desulfogranum japonicum]